MNALVSKAGSTIRSPASAAEELEKTLVRLPAISACWRALEPLPHNYQAALPRALALAEAALAPAAPEAMAVALGELIDWVEDFGVVKLPDDPSERHNRLKRLASRYRELLADLPDDLLLTAVQRIIRTHRFATLPLPADVRETVKEELAHRRVIKLQLSTAVRFARFEPPPVPDHERVNSQRIADLVAEAVGILRVSRGCQPAAELDE